MAIRTDLALEMLEMAGENLPQGVNKQEEQRGTVSVTRVDIQSEAAAQEYGKPVGRYITVEVDSFENTAMNFSNEIEAIAEEIRSLLPPEGSVLVAGLGNNDITPDALGPKTVSQTMATRHIPGELAKQTGLGELRQTAVIAPGVLGQTGMETSEIIASLVKEVSPGAVIVIDALASKSVDRLGRTIQISDTGIAPGAGVQNKRKELNRNTLGVPVIAVGVPTVVDMTTVAFDMLEGKEPSHSFSERGNTMMVTPREIDVIIEKSAKILSLAINKALQPSLSLEDLTALVS